MALKIEERRNGLKKWLNCRGVELVLWDLDDTLLDTVGDFIRQMNLYVDYLYSKLPNFPRKQLYDLLEKEGDIAFKTFSVSPRRWPAVAEVMAAELGAERKFFVEGLPILAKIYKMAPEFLEGAEEALAVFKATGLPMGLVTHANEAWTRIKLEKRKLRHFFERIKIVPENKFKEPDDWREAIELFGIAPEKVLVLGDNLGGDIRAARSVGVREIIYFPGRWRVYSSGEVPEGVMTIPGGVKDLIRTLVAEKE